MTDHGIGSGLGRTDAAGCALSVVSPHGAGAVINEGLKLMDERHKVHYERVPTHGSHGFVVPRDVIDRLGGDDVAHAVMADTFGFHALNAPVGTIPPNAVRDAGGRRVISKFIEMVRRRDAEGHAEDGPAKLSKAAADYRQGEPNRRCGLCTMFEPTETGRTAVKGDISPKALCDLFEVQRCHRI